MNETDRNDRLQAVRVNEPAQTWHHGLVARYWRYWAEDNSDSPIVAIYQALIEQYGQPALDAGCGTGRLLIPYLRTDLEVDGFDTSADMIYHCRERAESEGLKTNLYVQALHELDLPRSYQTIFACGVFGLGTERAQDVIGLRRLYDHLKPGGVLLINHHLPYRDGKFWNLWLKENWKKLPETWPDTIGKVPPKAEDHNIKLYSRMLAFDPLEQLLTDQLRAELWENGEFVRAEEHTMIGVAYFRNELRMMLENTGFEIEGIKDASMETDATPESDFIIFIARRPKTEVAGNIDRDRDAPRGAPLPHHHSYGSVSGDSADQAGSGPGEDKPE